MLQSNTVDLNFQDPDERKKIRDRLMGMGGLSLAAQSSEISYSRLSRMLKGWVKARPEDIAKLAAYLKDKV